MAITCLTCQDGKSKISLRFNASSVSLPEQYLSSWVKLWVKKVSYMYVYAETICP